MKPGPFLLTLLVSLTLAVSLVQAPAQTTAPAPSPQPLSRAPASSFGTPPAAPPSAATAAAAPQDIRDIRGLILIPNPLLWVVYLAAALLLAGLAFAVWRHFRRGAKAVAQQPFEIALERLEAARPLMTAGTVREYAIAVSETIRVYIETVFRERAAHRTTEEFLSGLLQQTGTPLALHQDRLADFLQFCDLTKFARWQLSATDMESMHESARAFVLETRPQSAPQTPAPPAPAGVSPPANPELAEAR